MNLLGAVVFKNSSIKWAMINIPDLNTSTSSTARVEANSYRNNNLGMAISNSSDINFDIVASDCTSCGNPYSGFCESTGTGQFICNWENPDPISCGESKINAEMGAMGSNSGKSLSMAEAYNFRDNFMKKTEVGRNYANFYYIISKVAVANNGINVKNVGKHFDFATRVHAVAKKIQFGADKEIVFQEDFRNEAQSFIDVYRKLSSDKTYLNTLATIENDLNRFTGKSRKEILVSIGL